MLERFVQEEAIAGFQLSDQHGFPLHGGLREQKCRERWRNSEGGEQRSQYCVAISLCHRGEDLALDPLHCEQGDEGCNDYCRREENGPVDFHRASEYLSEL